ncbi:MAG: flippase-like domain-containing protein [Gemmatimonadota bacterium]|nr:MAG: flippase-like domain-containing protein [Gemmatimonadota bacterium]
MRTVNSKSTARKIVSVFLLIAMAGAAVLYYTRHKDDFRLISAISVDTLLVLLCLVLFNFLCYGLQLKVLTDHYGLNLTFAQWFGLSRLSGFTYLFLPFPSGASLKALYLKKSCGLRYSSFAASLAVASIVRLAVFSFFSTVILLHIGDTGLFLTGIAGGVFIGTTFFLLFGDHIRVPYLSSLSPLIHILREWQKMRQDRTMIVRLIVLNCLIFAESGLTIYFSFRTFSVDAPILTCGIILTFTTFSSMLKLVPADLGIKEGMFMGISNLFGIGLNEGFHAAALHRIIGTVLTLLLAPGFGHALFKKEISEDD